MGTHILPYLQTFFSTPHFPQGSHKINVLTQSCITGTENNLLECNLLALGKLSVTDDRNRCPSFRI